MVGRGVNLTLSAQHLEAGGGIYRPTRDQLARALTTLPVTAGPEKIREAVDALIEWGDTHIGAARSWPGPLRVRVG
ncbi:hypothetical protein [Cryobacterium sp. PH31-L1]|uniref:hypothetical protein n=1 Tax=Cryobacterium sp. PH31-L1 TaxID=3046199 RepID=UPI0024B903EE|nr:hypothetical protein [Cryobacterium sp. PH31-L1]